MGKHWATKRLRHWSTRFLKRHLSGGQDNTGHTNLCESQRTRKTGNIAVAEVKAYTIVNTVNKLKHWQLVYTQANVFATANSVTETMACFYR